MCVQLQKRCAVTKSNTLRLWQNGIGCYFPINNLKYISWDENCCISRSGAKPLSEPLLVYSNNTLRNKCHWNFNRNATLFHQEKDIPCPGWWNILLASLALYHSHIESALCMVTAGLSAPGHQQQQCWCFGTELHHQGVIVLNLKCWQLEMICSTCIIP